MNSFINPLVGGVLIGLASSLMLWLLGQVAGISGIYSNIFNLNIKGNLWRHFFILGMIAGGFFFKFLNPELLNFPITSSLGELVFAGLMVGIGTRLGSGCTSGHGVCGLGRLSARSLVATLTFILAGVITVFIKGLL